MMNNIQNMIDTISRESLYSNRKMIDEKVMDVMHLVDRKIFVPSTYANNAYDNGPLPIGFGQTISQPYIVALMTDLLELKPDYKVLEIGTGSGYQTAILSHLVDKIYTIEYIAALAWKTKHKLKKMGYKNIEFKRGNGYFGWEEKSPFDAIIVTAAAPHIPPQLIKQLKSGGRMVIPVGQPFLYQVLMLVTKDDKGEINTESITPVSFVPLVNEETELAG